MARKATKPLPILYGLENGSATYPGETTFTLMRLWTSFSFLPPFETEKDDFLPHILTLASAVYVTSKRRKRFLISARESGANASYVGVKPKNRQKEAVIHCREEMMEWYATFYGTDCLPETSKIVGTIFGNHAKL